MVTRGHGLGQSVRNLFSIQNSRAQISLWEDSNAGITIPEEWNDIMCGRVQTQVPLIQVARSGTWNKAMQTTTASMLQYTEKVLLNVRAVWDRWSIWGNEKWSSGRRTSHLSNEQVCYLMYEASSRVIWIMLFEPDWINRRKLTGNSVSLCFFISLHLRLGLIRKSLISVVCKFSW